LKLFDKKVNDSVDYIEKKCERLEKHVDKFSEELRLKNEYIMDNI
jgi:prefoldin subunit 5